MTRGFAFDLSDMIATRREPEPEAPASPPDVLCLTLREIAARYAAPCPFKPGDLVTPRAGYNYTGAGEPCIVLEVRETPIDTTSIAAEPRDVTSNSFGVSLDVRVACEDEGTIVAYWQESWRLEPYTGPDAGRADDAGGER